MSSDAAMDAWLRRLKWALSTVPSPEREDIVAETAMHFDERIAHGKSPKDVIASFGAPEIYARSFLDEMELSRALGSQSAAAMFSVVTRRVHRSLAAACAFLTLTVVAAVDVIVGVTAFWKVWDPAHTGLWSGPNIFFLGVIADPKAAHDILGKWVYLLALLVLALSWLLCRFVLLWSLNRVAYNSPPRL